LCTSANRAPYRRVQAALPKGGLIRDVKRICDDFSCVSCSMAQRTSRAACGRMSLTLLRCTPDIRENLLGRRCFRSCWAAGAFRQDWHPRASGSSGRRKGAGDARATVCPSWRSLIATERGRGPREPADVDVNGGGIHHADFGRYSVATTHGRVPRFVARWHRSRGPFTEGKNITGAPTIEAAKAACERHAGAADRHSIVRECASPRQRT
jgi:hypothetical protein